MSTTLFSETEAALRGAAEHPGAAVVGLGRGWSRGSGVIIAPGRVLTSAHNIRHDELTLTFADGEQRPGRVLATDPEADAAVIETDTGSTQPISWDPQRAAAGIGTPVLALANPGGRGLRVTPGFVVAAPRALRGPRGRRIPGAI